MSSAGDGIKTQNANWKFKGKMVESFEDHIKKSVPLYEEGHQLICELSDYFVKEDSTVYELGSSTGKLSHSLAKRHAQKGAKFVAIEKEKDMYDFAKECYKLDNLEFVEADITEFDYKRSDLFISYYTMQFIHPKHRQSIFDTIYESLEWGGAFVLFEKVRANDARFQDIMSGLYNEFKLKNGYTPEEILNKSMSLKGVLEPFSTQGNIDLLKRAGFVDIISIQKYINFEGFLAIK